MTTAADTPLDPISNRVARIERGEDPQLLARLPAGYAILANQQPEPLTGCCMLLPHPGRDGRVPPSLNTLGHAARAAFLADLARLGDAVLEATDAEHLNYEILCNQVPALHGHVIPRFAHEDPSKRPLAPFAAYDFAEAPRAEPNGRHAALIARLRDALAKGTPAS